MLNALSFLLDGNHIIIKLFVRDFHHRHQHQFTVYLSVLVHSELANFDLHASLKVFEVPCLISRKRKMKTFKPMIAKLPKNQVGYSQPPSAKRGLKYFWTVLRLILKMFRSEMLCCYAIQGNSNISHEVLKTTFCLFEKPLNACPITSVSASHDGFDLLSPDQPHLLLGLGRHGYDDMVALRALLTVKR